MRGTNPGAGHRIVWGFKRGKRVIGEITSLPLHDSAGLAARFSGASLRAASHFEQRVQRDGHGVSTGSAE
jgi:hypothetical protein